MLRLRKWTLAAVLAGTLAGVGAAQGVAKFLTNDDIVAMVKGGQSEDAILNAIQAQGTDFDVSTKAVLQLKKSGVSKKVLDAMVAAVKDQQEAAAAVMSAAQSKAAAQEAEEKAEVAREEASRTASAAAAVTGTTAAGAAVPGQPSVMMVQGGQKRALALAHVQIVPANTKLPSGNSANPDASSMDGLSSDGGLMKNLSTLSKMMSSGGGMPGVGGPGGMPGMKGGPGVASMIMMANPMFAPALMATKLFAAHKAASQAAAGQNAMTAVWTIPGVKSETVVHGGQPSFEVQFDGIAGVNPEDYEPALIRLTPSQSNYRLVGATSLTASQMQDSQADWSLYSSFVEQRVPAQATKTASGRYQIQPSAGLGPGEYGVVLRPVNKDKKFSGSNVGQNVGDGLVFNCVWSFEIQ